MINNLNNWNEVTKGIYRYVVAAGVCYEIHLEYWNHDTEILTATASVYVAGDWRDSEGNNFFERELLLKSRPVFECIAAAHKDYKESMQ